MTKTQEEVQKNRKSKGIQKRKERKDRRKRYDPIRSMNIRKRVIRHANKQVKKDR